ncbi:MAG: MutS-related protein [Acidimicrobiales bacterium]
MVEPQPSHEDSRRDAATFVGLLFPTSGPDPSVGDDRSYAVDLNLDQVVASVVSKREDPQYLTTLFYRHLDDLDAVRYRQEVFSDLEDPGLRRSVERFSTQMSAVRAHLRQLKKMDERHQRRAWHLDAASIYCAGVRAFFEELAPADLASRGLSTFRAYLGEYVSSSAFTSLDADTAQRKKALGSIRYCTLFRDGKVEVSRFNDEADYSAEILRTFERFRQGAVDDYLVKYRTWPGINHITAKILQLVARLYPEEFRDLEVYCSRHALFFDDTVRRFEQEVQFYLAYLACLDPLRSAGLPFSCPELVSHSKDIFAAETFDLALAAKLIPAGSEVVTNDFELEVAERILVVTGPNQGGKTTFARTFGQLHHLASLGCPVPGSRARLLLFDRLFTQFEREESLARMSGKLEDDIARVRELLTSATSRSIVILNEVFSSTTLHDARFLGVKLLERIVELDALCVYVTFVDELAQLGDSVVSMMSTVVPEDPARRTFKVVRRPADGLAYALAIAERRGVTYEQLRRRLAR